MALTKKFWLQKYYLYKIFKDTAFTKQKINTRDTPFIQLYCNETKQVGME